jgi:molybdopterin-guanine dinucleotide biosynthesis protein A
MGPLAGLAAALHLAADEGYEAVLTCGVDAVVLPDDLPAVLGAGPACLDDQPVIGIWPITVIPALEALLHSDDRHAFYRLAEIVGARRVQTQRRVPNINTPEDLAAIQLRPDGIG